MNVTKVIIQSNCLGIINVYFKLVMNNYYVLIHINNQLINIKDFAA